MRCIVQTDTHIRCMHADHMLILPALPHFSEAMSNVSQPSEGAADAETSTEAECRGNLLQGTRQAAEQRQGLAGACPGRSVWGLYWPGGVYGLVGGFLSIWTGLMWKYDGLLETTKMKQRKQRDSTTHLAEEWKCTQSRSTVNKNFWLNASQCNIVCTLRLGWKSEVAASYSFILSLRSNVLYVSAAIVGDLHYRGQCVAHVCAQMSFLCVTTSYVQRHK